MPADNRVWLDEEQRISPPGYDARQEHEQTAFMRAESGPFDLPGRDQQLLPKQRVLCEELLTRANTIAEQTDGDGRGAQDFADRGVDPGYGLADRGPYASFEYHEKHGAGLLEVCYDFNLLRSPIS